MFNISVKALVKNSHSEYLLLIRADDNPRRSGEFDLPGGKVEDYEDPKDSMIRELKEETGLVVKEAVLLDTFHESMSDKITMIYKVFVGEDSKVVLSKEHKDYIWTGSDIIEKLPSKYSNVLKKHI